MLRKGSSFMPVKYSAIMGAWVHATTMHDSIGIDRMEADPSPSFNA